MTRAHPFVLDGTRLIVPLYSDGFSFSLMAITDDWGATWKTSTPLVGGGNIQPSLAQEEGRHARRLHARQRSGRPSGCRSAGRAIAARRGARSTTRTCRTPAPAPKCSCSRTATGSLIYNDLEQRPLQPGGVDLRRRGRDLAVDAAPRARPGLDRRAAARAVSLPVDHPGARRHAARDLQLLRSAGVGEEGRRGAPDRARRSSTRTSTRRG